MSFVEFKSWFLLPIGFFYLGQGFSLGSLVILLPQYMQRVLGVANESEASAIAAIILIPWYLKILFGIVSDNISIGKFGRRRPYLLISTIISALGWFTLPLHNSASTLFVLSGLGLAFGSALSDAVLDAQSVEITPVNFTGRLQGVAWGSRGIGAGLAGYVSTSIVEIFGWSDMIYFAGFFGVSITLAAMFLPQRKVTTSQSLVSGFRNVIEVYRRLGEGRRSRVIYFFTSGIVLAPLLLLTYIMGSDFGYSLEEIGRASLLFALGNGGGAYAMGLVFDHHDSRARVIILNLLTALSFLASLLFVLPNPRVLTFVYIGILGFGLGGYEAFQLKVIQESSPDDLEGTAFSLWTSISNIGQIAVGAVILTNIAVILKIPFSYVTILVLIPMGIAFYFLSTFQVERWSNSEL